MGSGDALEPPTDAGSRERLRTLIYGYQRTQLVYAAATLGLADHLAAAPCRLDDLAARTQVDAEVLQRLLNGLLATSVVTQTDDSRYALTAVGDGLRTEVPGSLATLAILSGEEYYRAWLGLPAALHARDGRTPFEHVHGAPLFD